MSGAGKSGTLAAILKDKGASIEKSMPCLVSGANKVQGVAKSS